MKVEGREERGVVVEVLEAEGISLLLSTVNRLVVDMTSRDIDLRRESALTAGF